MKSFYKLLLAVVFLSPLFSFAQGYYKQGFVINTKGDTVKGYIDLREWGANPKSINFKQSLDKSAQVLTVNDIRVFELPGYVAYKSFTTSISLDVTDLQKLGYARDTSTKIDNVFLKVEQRGKNVTLYSYTDDLKDRFYLYDHQDNSIRELIYRIYYVQNEKNNVSTVSQNAYKQQLLLSAQKYNYSDNLKSMIEDAEYDKGDLVNICRKINNAEKSKKNTGVHGKNIRLFAGVGAGFNKITLSGTTPLYNAVPSYSSVSPKISAGINFYPSPDVARSVLKLEVAYSTATYKTNGTLYFYDQSKTSTLNVTQNNISVIPQFQYALYNTDPFKFYVDLGLSINLSSYSHNSVYNPVTQETDNNFIGFNDRWFSIPLKAGIILNKHIDISVDYVFPTHISDNVNGHHQDFQSDFKYTTLQAGVGYIF